MPLICQVCMSDKMDVLARQNTNTVECMGISLEIAYGNQHFIKHTGATIIDISGSRPPSDHELAHHCFVYIVDIETQHKECVLSEVWRV